MIWSTCHRPSRVGSNRLHTLVEERKWLIEPLKMSCVVCEVRVALSVGGGAERSTKGAA